MNAERAKDHPEIQKQHKKIKALRGKNCELCNWPSTLENTHGNLDSFTLVDCHHIIPYSEGGRERDDNIIVLCKNCHALADRGIISEIELLEANGAIDRTYQ